MSRKLKLINQLVEVLPEDDTETYPRLDFNLKNTICATPLFENNEESTDIAAGFKFHKSNFYIPRVIKKILLLSNSNYKMTDLYKDYKTKAIIRDELLTSDVTDMNNMFSGCSALLSIPKFDTSSATNMSNMFAGCNSLSEVFPWVIDCSSISNANDMINMFANSSVTYVKLSNTKKSIRSQITSSLLKGDSSLTIEFETKTFDNSQLFTSNGTFVVPEGVTAIYVSGSAGGGGGGGGPVFVQYNTPAPVPRERGTSGSSGGNTTIVATQTITLYGGGGGQGAVGNSSIANGTSYTNEIDDNTLNTKYGNGGSGGPVVVGGVTAGGSGGHGQTCWRTKTNVTPNQNITFTIGSGGSAGYGRDYNYSYTYGSAGQQGFVLIEWDNPIP